MRGAEPIGGANSWDRLQVITRLRRARLKPLQASSLCSKHESLSSVPNGIRTPTNAALPHLQG
ncbi:hypothetical protein COCMIDRAFT_91205 [Bipolaris oryzae ATCC 44560]|uniref:Uncharacterized protein n=1 Tax=Bipolaris oryzae ATCC 44560 TaxID=930090 RepID=W6ZAS2_COCMI|nr:uncharacterized protein COCMIDRAFT_91205 [Bipolaris oryzae ATCC 44560]EUC47070.1 hypothetical protein COCMIDRAFT_91205 [Bipolaris oryzae ATCC 44560]